MSSAKKTHLLYVPAFAFLLFAGFVLVGVLPAFAEDFSSANFIFRAPVMDIFGGRSTSSGFEQLNAGGQTAVGISTSTNFILRSGFLYFDDVFIPESQNWRWFDDETSETPAIPMAAENTAPSDVANQNIIKLRFTIRSGSIAGQNVKFKLQFSEYSDFSQKVNDAVEIGDCAPNSLWCYADGAGADNGVITTNVLSDSDVCSGGVGNGCGTHNESGVTASAFTHKHSSAAEYEFTIKHAGARANAAYFFRPVNVADNEVVPLNVGAAYPSLSTEGAALTFTISGLPAATSTEGIITDAATTPTGVLFGALSFDEEIEAAQRLTVTTNATEGYQIFMFQRQNFSHSAYATEIAPIGGTNESPASWTAGCLSAVSGCYGYHAGDDSLAGGSVRFAANNTYAQFETAPKEIAFSSFPVSDESNDIIFKMQITNQQPAGDYSGSVVYIVVPAF